MELPAYYFAPDKRCLFRLHASVAIVDVQNRVLLVQEAKKDSRGKWNLPGGHVDHGESIAEAARRETREETGIDAKLSGLLGVYSGSVSARFIFRADSTSGDPHAGDEILNVRWMAIDELLGTDDVQFVSARILKRAAQDLKLNRLYPLELITPHEKLGE